MPANKTFLWKNVAHACLIALAFGNVGCASSTSKDGAFASSAVYQAVNSASDDQRVYKLYQGPIQY